MFLDGHDLSFLEKEIRNFSVIRPFTYFRFTASRQNNSRIPSGCNWNYGLTATNDDFLIPTLALIGGFSIPAPARKHQGIKMDGFVERDGANRVDSSYCSCGLHSPTSSNRAIAGSTPTAPDTASRGTHSLGCGT